MNEKFLIIGLALAGCVWMILFIVYMANLDRYLGEYEKKSGNQLRPSIKGILSNPMYPGIIGIVVPKSEVKAAELARKRFEKTRVGIIVLWGILFGAIFLAFMSLQ